MADIDDLKATFEQIVGVINRRDPAAYASYFHEQLVAFPPFFPFAVDGKAAARQFAEANLANPNTESTSFTPLNPQYRVIDSTGIVWGHTALSLKPKVWTVDHNFYPFHLCVCKNGGEVVRGVRALLATTNWRLNDNAARPSRCLGSRAVTSPALGSS